MVLFVFKQEDSTELAQLPSDPLENIFPIKLNFE
jgi:hypothetical protein